MVKKVKKRARNDQRAKQTPATFPRNVLQTTTNRVEASEDVAVVTNKARELCSHKNREINLSALSAKLGSADSYNCEDCHQGKKGRGNKHGKKGAAGSKATWICLDCAHFSCGGAGLPDTPQSHAVRHSKTNRHPLAVHYKNHQLLWCFMCKKLVATEMSEDNELVVILQDIAKLLRGEPEERPGADVEDVWFGGRKETTSDRPSSIISVHATTGYSVRGLINLGNTCFFNSIVQNVLAIESLREHFVRGTESFGPLCASLRNLFLESVGASSFKSAMDPRAVFTSLCSKAPQFKGYQQHDSQELLRCLLDALSFEESSARKLVDSSQKESKVHLTFVDSVFGGQLSSTVCCLECGHSSTVFEPFLDLSLPVPNRRSSSAKRVQQPAARGKKSKLPPKRNGRSSLSSRSSRVSSRADITVQENRLVLSAGGELPSSRGSNDATNMAFDMGLTVEDVSSTGNPQSSCENVTEQCNNTSLDCFSWLDYLDNDLEKDDMSAIDSSASENLQINASYSANNLAEDIAATSIHERKDFDDLQPVITGHEDPLTEVEDSSNANAHIGEKQSTNCDVSNEVVSPNLPEDQLCDEDSNASHGDNEDRSDNQVPEVTAPPIEVVKEEEARVSSAVVKEEQDSSDFNVFGSLFDEPEETTEPKSSVSEASDTEANEVDDDESTPVSVESCLALFTKPEILSKEEHEWQCDNCSKTLREEMRTRKAAVLPNGFEHHQSNGPTGNENSNVSAITKVDKDVGDDCNNEEEMKERPNFEAADECSSSSGSAEEEGSGDFKVKRDATKSILISKAPSILTIHLKRFSLDARGRLSKLNGYVGFKEVIDLKPYMDPRAGDKEVFNYRLIGVVEHSGTMRGGHYVAYVKGKGRGLKEDCWYHASDAYVREASMDEVLRSEAYILFYEGF